MNCPNCGAEIPDESLFCLKCGTRLPDPPSNPERPTGATADADADRTEGGGIRENDAVGTAGNSDAEGTSGNYDAEETVGNVVQAEGDSFGAAGGRVGAAGGRVGAAGDYNGALGDRSEAAGNRIAARQAAKVTQSVPGHRSIQPQGSAQSQENFGSQGNFQPHGSAQPPVTRTDGRHSKSNGGTVLCRMWFIVLMCVLVPPFGIFLIWKYRKPGSSGSRIALTVLAGLLLVTYIAVPVIASQPGDSGTSETAASTKVKRTTFNGLAFDELSSDWEKTKRADGDLEYTYKQDGEEGAKYKIILFATNESALSKDRLLTLCDEYREVFYQQQEGVTLISSEQLDGIDCAVVKSDTFTAKVSGGREYNGRLTVVSMPVGQVGFLLCDFEKDGGADSDYDHLIDSVALLSSEKDAYSALPEKATQAALGDAANMASITAKWTGSTSEGTAVTVDKITVTATYNDGSEGNLTSDQVSIDPPSGALAAASDYTVTVISNDRPDLTYPLTITCTTIPTEYKNALSKAQWYSDNLYMSYQGLYDQLTSSYGEGFSPEAAQYAVDHVNADWNYNALMSAKSYEKNLQLSPNRIHDQLTSEYGEQFTEEQADYAIEHLDD